MRSDEGDAAVELLVAYAGQSRSERGREDVAVRARRPHRVAVVVEEGPVGETGGPASPADRGVGLVHQRQQRLDQLEPAGEQLGAGRREVAVPDVEGVKG